ncbi:hypothetical protein [Flavobacterium sp. AG291]|uniref:hypothetical protein n=1 Tax=Flavobacterium sp. AG291 TaxID=2184000 RepID=UPI000E0A66EC|nr:hypothetical protein [Flavobacterium sp. AG291]RDI15980.1 hypothetical protein DEU42_101276 [Flavobacterium sp. AG291]
MKKILLTLLATIPLLNLTAHAQQSRSEEIMKLVTDYYLLERENIHVQFDKNAFMTNETIWFKGYVFHRKINAPSPNTTNIYASLMDDQGKIIETKLLFGNRGGFTGFFKLNSKFNSGKYYLQFYTNWMNNFSEDDSAVYETAVINPQQGSGTALAKADPSKINIDINPEGGKIISGLSSTIGIHVTDCNNNPLAISTVDIVDGSGKIFKQVQLNKLGFGKFDLPANASTNYKAVVTIEDVKHEKTFPVADLTGISLEVNNYAIADKTMIKARTNKATINLLNKQPVYMLVHQDAKTVIMELNLNNANFEQTLIIPNADLSPGMNTIRILDSNLIQLSERLFFNYPKTGLTVDITKTEQSATKQKYQGKVNHSNMNLSLTVLPENTISFDDTNDIYGSFLLLPYIQNQHKASGRHYFTTLSKNKLYELDLFLINQKSKYQWINIKQNPPKSNYPFDLGLTLKGTIPSGIDSKGGRIRLYSLTSGIDENTEVNDNREFEFKNLVIDDSSYVNFTLIKRGLKPKEITITPQILNGSRKFNKPYKPEPHFYTPQYNDETFKNPNIFSDNTSIELEEVKIEGNALKYANSYGNGDLRGYKISDSNANSYQTLLQFIKTYGGFYINENHATGQLDIYTRTINSVNAAQAKPIIYLDNFQLMDYSMLSLIQTSEVDEIYMSSTAIVPSIRNFQGMIKIYLKKGVRPRYLKNNTPDIVVKSGFEKPKLFQNVTYNSVDDKGFENFGIIDWQPNVWSDNKGEFSISIPKMTSKPMKVLIEGFSADGKLISEIKTIDPKS